MDDNNELQEMQDDEEELKQNAKIKVIGVGGGGGNAVNGMIHDNEDLVEYWVFNTDCQALSQSLCENKLVLGRNVTRGLGAGGNPKRGKEAAEETYEEIKRVVSGSDLVFIAAGEGGGTGTGGAPVVAKAAREAGCLVVGIVTRPFNFEGKTRRTNALEGINELKENVDAIIVVSNDKLMFNDGNLPSANAFHNADAILGAAVKTVTDIILKPGLINLDFADVDGILRGKGLALIGIGHGKGERKTIEAAENAINSPLLESSIRGARSMIISFTISPDTTLTQIQAGVNYITEKACGSENGGGNNVVGFQIDPELHDEVSISIIATDFNKDVGVIDEVIPTTPSAENGQQEMAEPVSETEKRIEEERNSSVLPSFLRKKFAELDAAQAKKESDENENHDVGASSDDEEPSVLSSDSSSIKE